MPNNDIGDLTKESQDEIIQPTVARQNSSVVPLVVSTAFSHPLDENLCNLLIQEIENNSKEFRTGLTGNFSSPDYFMLKKIRNSEVYFLPVNHWAYGIVWNYVKIANDENWQLDISNVQTIQITKYSEGGFYNWHHDFSANKNDPNYFRKLSITIQLNDPSEYEGGVLQLLDYSNRRIDCERKKGHVCVFSGRAPHRVTKIKSGVRYSLVAWIVGPQLR